MQGVELSCLSFWGLGASGKKRPWKNPAKEFNFHTDVPGEKKKQKNKRLFLISGKRKYANKVALGEFAACVRPAAPEL